MSGDAAIDDNELKNIAKVLKEEKKRAMRALNSVLRGYTDKYDVAKKFYDDLSKQRAQFLYCVLEVTSGAKFPAFSIVSRAAGSLSTLQSAIKGQKWAQMQKAIAAAEKDINRLDREIKGYFNAFKAGATATIEVVKFAKTQGFIAIGILATTFAGGPMAAYMGLKGLVAAGTGAAIGGFIKAQIDTVVTCVGRELDGQDVNYGKVLIKHCEKTTKAVGIGLFIQGPCAKLINAKLVKSVFASKYMDKQNLEVLGRLTAAEARTLLIAFWNRDGKKVAKKNSKFIGKKLKGKETEAQVFERVLGDAVQSKEFKAFLKKEMSKRN